jgi:hypothetical protein
MTGREIGAKVNKDGRAWRIGEEADVAWIRENTGLVRDYICDPSGVRDLRHPGAPDGDHLSAVPLEDSDRHNAGVLAVLSEHSAGQSWWLGYLDTGGADIVFYNAQKVRLGPTSAWYVLVEAGPEQVRVWREPEHRKSPLPDLMFITDAGGCPNVHDPCHTSGPPGNPTKAQRVTADAGVGVRATLMEIANRDTVMSRMTMRRCLVVSVAQLEESRADGVVQWVALLGKPYVVILKHET